MFKETGLGMAACSIPETVAIRWRSLTLETPLTRITSWPYLRYLSHPGHPIGLGWARGEPFIIPLTVTDSLSPDFEDSSNEMTPAKTRALHVPESTRR